jgi:hypothetical protein
LEGRLAGKDQLEEPDIEYNIKMHLQEEGWGGAWTGFIQLRIGAGRLLRMR